MLRVIGAARTLELFTILRSTCLSSGPFIPSLLPCSALLATRAFLISSLSCAGEILSLLLISCCCCCLCTPQRVFCDLIPLSLPPEEQIREMLGYGLPFKCCFPSRSFFLSRKSFQISNPSHDLRQRAPLSPVEDSCCELLQDVRDLSGFPLLRKRS